MLLLLLLLLLFLFMLLLMGDIETLGPFFLQVF